LTVPTDKRANAGLKVASMVGGMVAGADSIDDMGLLCHGGMRKLFTACYAPSTLVGRLKGLETVSSFELARPFYERDRAAGEVR